MIWLVDHGFAKNITAVTKISNCCEGKAKTAFKYKWKFAEQPK